MVANINFTASHSVSGRISGAAMNQNLSCVHRIAYGVLRICVYGNRGVI